MPTSPIDTAKVTGRRQLHFNTVDDLIAEVNRVAEAARQGKAKTLGNWSAAQILDHLATSYDAAYEGLPFKAPLLIRFVFRVMKTISFQGTVRLALKPGFQLPEKASALLPPPTGNIDAARTRLLGLLDRLRRGDPITHPSPILGRMTMDQWMFLHLRHAELHLSFIVLE